MKTQLTKNFSLEEMYRSEKADTKKIDNTPPEGVVENLRKLATTLEEVREVLGHPVKINSGYRCLALNLAIGGSKQSSHMTGCAADIVCPGFGTAKQVMDAILKSGVLFHKIIYEQTWVHISIPHEAANQGYDMIVLEAVFEPGKPVRYIPYKP